MSGEQNPMNPEPVFANEDAERAYWAKEDLTDQFDWESAVEPSLPELRPSTVSISIRLPISLLEDLKSLANARDAVSYTHLSESMDGPALRLHRGATTHGTNTSANTPRPLARRIKVTPVGPPLTAMSAACTSSR